MKCQEKTEKKTESKEKRTQVGCCSPESATDMMASHCMDTHAKGAEGMKTMMSKCCTGMKVFRWFPSIPVALGVVAFLMGYFLSPEIVRFLWLIVSGTVVLVGILGLILMGSACRTQATSNAENRDQNE